MFDIINNVLRRWSLERIPLTVLILFSILLGIHNSFIQDDAFISFRYAAHWLAGHGLVWNIGEPIPVEGYSNFLWVVLIAIGMALRVEPVLWSSALGLLAGGGTLLLSYRLALRCGGSPAMALITVLLLGSNYSFSSYMTGGLETQLQTFLVVLAAYMTIGCHGIPCRRSLIALSLVLALAVLTRMDSLLLGGILYLYLLGVWLPAPLTTRQKVMAVSYLTLPALLVGMVWLLFRLSYYGELLPNTYYIKAADWQWFTMVRGLSYVATFVMNYGLLAPLLLLGYYSRHLLRDTAPALLSVMVSLWFIYVIRIGGDFMEYRFFIPVLPFLFILLVRALALLNHTPAQAVLLVMVLLASPYHAVTFQSFGIEGIPSLQRYITDPEAGWRVVGLKLGALFADAATPVTIATTAAGAIPYYSTLPTIDLHGLNDRWIARHGVVIGGRPGHNRYASLEYVLASGVNLMLGHPLVSSIHDPVIRGRQDFFPSAVETAEMPKGTRVIAIPLNQHYQLDLLYLTPHEAVEQLIEQHDLPSYPLSSSNTIDNGVFPTWQENPSDSG